MHIFCVKIKLLLFYTNKILPFLSVNNYIIQNKQKIASNYHNIIFLIVLLILFSSINYIIFV